MPKGGSRRRSGGGKGRKGGASRRFSRAARARLSKAVKDGVEKSPFKRRRRGDTGAADQEQHRRDREEEAGKPKKRQRQVSDLKKATQNLEDIANTPAVSTPKAPGGPGTGASGPGHTGGPHDPVTTGVMVLAAIFLGAKRRLGNKGKG